MSTVCLQEDSDSLAIATTGTQATHLLQVWFLAKVLWRSPWLLLLPASTFFQHRLGASVVFAMVTSGILVYERRNIVHTYAPWVSGLDSASYDFHIVVAVFALVMIILHQLLGMMTA